MHRSLGPAILFSACALLAQHAVAAPEKVQATTMDQARAAARASIGRGNPMQGFARARTAAPAHKVSHRKSGFVPPPPPTVPSLGQLQAMELRVPIGCPIFFTPPAPPPPLAPQVKLVGMMDGKVILSLPADLRAKNGWPHTVTIGEGEKFDSLSVVSINDRSVTLLEGKKRSTKNLESVH